MDKKYYNDQDYDEIKRECLEKGILWEDPTFPADDTSLFYKEKLPYDITWTRASEIANDPAFILEGASRFDINQGMLGDCWLLSAIASLSLNTPCLYRVVPPDQTFRDGYAGIFKFRFWQYGEWVTVCVDDRLPVYRGRLVFLQSKDRNEFWGALLEKAYAKLNITYEALKGGTQVESMEDFTGGVGETYDLRDKAPPNLWKILKRAMHKSSMAGCSIGAQRNATESKLDNGLITAHAYSITAVTTKTVRCHDGVKKAELLRIRNPWGQTEWNGAWSDESAEWKLLAKSERDEIGLVFENDGEFWMSYDDFVQAFERLEIVNLSPELQTGATWVVTTSEGKWQKGVSAGGCANFKDTFWINPQIRMTLEEEDDDDDDDDDPNDSEGGCTVVGALMQKNRRRQRELGKEMLTIGYAAYKIDDNAPVPLPKDYFLYHRAAALTKTFINSRENGNRHKLPKGEYIFVPSTFDPGEEGDFVFRVFSLKKSSTSKIDEKTSSTDPASKPRERDTINDAVEQKFKNFFAKISGVDMEVDAEELQKILSVALKEDLGHDGIFSLNTCKSAVALFDKDLSGKLGYKEFKELWMDIRAYKNVFEKYDKDKSGYFNSYELRSALSGLGYSLSFKAFSMLVLRHGGNDNHFELDDFIQCIIKLRATYQAFGEVQKNPSMGIDEFMTLTLYS
ncbi:calpain-1 catalytic subunit-like [Glandiceps talaboti]